MSQTEQRQESQPIDWKHFEMWSPVDPVTRATNFRAPLDRDPSFAAWVLTGGTWADRIILALCAVGVLLVAVSLWRGFGVAP